MLSPGVAKSFLESRRAHGYKKMLLVLLSISHPSSFLVEALFGGATLTLRLRVEKHPRHYIEMGWLTPARLRSLALSLMLCANTAEKLLPPANIIPAPSANKNRTPGKQKLVIDRLSDEKFSGGRLRFLAPLRPCNHQHRTALGVETKLV